MKFEEYRRSAEFEKGLTRKRTRRRAMPFWIVSLVMIFVLTVGLHYFTEYADSLERVPVWLWICFAFLLVLFVGAWIAEIVLETKAKERRGHFLDSFYSVGLLLYFRGIDFSLSDWIKGEKIELKISVLAPKGNCNFVKLSAEGREVELDLSPWGGMEVYDAVLAAQYFLIAHLDGYLPFPTSVFSYAVTDLGFAEGERTRSGLIVKDGKFTLFGRLLRGDYRTARKYLVKKHLLEEE